MKEGVIIRVKIETGKQKNQIKTKEGNYLEVELKPESMQEANLELLNLFSNLLDVDKNKIRIRRGRDSETKELYLNMKAAEVESRIDEF